MTAASRGRQRCAAGPAAAPGRPGAAAIVAAPQLTGRRKCRGLGDAPLARPAAQAAGGRQRRRRGGCTSRGCCDAPQLLLLPRGSGWWTGRAARCCPATASISRRLGEAAGRLRLICLGLVGICSNAAAREARAGALAEKAGEGRSNKSGRQASSPGIGLRPRALKSDRPAPAAALAVCSPLPAARAARSWPATGSAGLATCTTRTSTAR